MAIELTPKNATVVNPTTKAKETVSYNRIKVTGDDAQANFADLLQNVFAGDLSKVIKALVFGANKEAKASVNPYRTAARDARKKVTAALKMVKLMTETMGVSETEARQRVSVLTGIELPAVVEKTAE